MTTPSVALVARDETKLAAPRYRKADLPTAEELVA